MMGSKQVFPGRHVNAESLLELFDREQVTFSGGVPTVWLPVLDLLDQEPKRWKLAPGLRVGVAGYLRSRNREEDGKRRRVVEVVGLRVDFLGGPRDSETETRSVEVMPFEAAATP